MKNPLLSFLTLVALLFFAVQGQQIDYNQQTFFLNGLNDYTPSTLSNYLRTSKGIYLYQNKAKIVLNPYASATIPLFDSGKYLDLTSFSISGWYYTCQSGDYHIISRQNGISAFDEIFSIRVDGSGQFIVHYFEGTIKTFYTGIFTYSGWNYFALTVNQYSTTTSGSLIYYNDLDFYAGNDQFDSVDLNGYGLYAKIQKFTTTWSRSVQAIQLDFSFTNTNLMFGCRQYEGSASPQLFTGFMHGFLHSIRIYNQAVGLEILSQDWSAQCDGACGMCSSIDQQCHDQIEDSFLAKMDFAAGVSNNYVSDSSGNSNQLLLVNSPVSYQGILFKQGKYASDTTGSYFQIPKKQIFCIESWFKLDLMNPNPDNFIGYIFGKYDNTNLVYQLAIGISNNFMRVILGTNYYDKPYSFLDGNWHFIQACFRSSETTQNTQLILWVDDQQGADIQTFYGVYSENSAYNTYIGKDLSAVMRSLSINQNIDWDCSAESQIISSHITSNYNYIVAIAQNISQIAVQSACLGYGSTNTCDYCSPIQYPSQTSTYQCFSNCSFNTYDQYCSQCDYRCKYCTDSTLLRCSQCNEFNYAFLNSTGLCQCAPGFYTNDTAKQCSQCNQNCALCDNSTNICLVCASGSYRIYNNQCVKQCPTGYYGNDTYGICMYQPIVVPSPDYKMGCQPQQYYDKIFQSCLACDPTCLTCRGEFSNYCLSCARGRYLSQVGTNTYSCPVCDSVAMYYGTNGDCVEICGDGKDFGLNQCEDGNLYNGDGCSSTCQIENNWSCSRGSKTKPGSCTPIPTQILSVNLTADNNLLFEFTNDIMILGELTLSDLQVVVYNVATGRLLQSINMTNFTTLNWSLPEQIYGLLPSKVFYIKLDQQQLSQDIQVIQNLKNSSRIGVIYQGTGKLRDERNADLKANQLLTAYFNYQFIENSATVQNNDQTSRTLGLAATSIGLAGIFINMLSYLITNKSVMPAFYSFITLQSIYLMIIMKNSNYPDSIRTFLKSFDFTLLEFSFIPVFLKDEIIDTYIPKRGIFPDELEAIDFYYNTVVYNIFRKIILWLVYFFALLPLSALLKQLFGKDSDALNAWPDKFFFSGTMILFFINIQPLMLASVAEINLSITSSDYEYASYCLACLIVAVIAVSVLNSLLLILRHSSVSDHPIIQLRFNTLFTPFKQRNMFAHLFFPLLLSAKIFLVYDLQCTTKFTNITGMIISAALILYYGASRPFRFRSNTIFVIACEGILIVLNGIVMSYSSQDLSRSNLNVKDILFMAIVLIGCVANLVWSSFDCVVSIITWKKARDAGRANPFQVIPTYKYKNKKFFQNSQGIFEKATNSINFSQINQTKSKPQELETNRTQDNSDGSNKKINKLKKKLDLLNHMKKEEIDPSYLGVEGDKDYIDLDKLYGQQSKPQDSKYDEVINQPNENSKSFTHFGLDKKRTRTLTNNLNENATLKSDSKRGDNKDFESVNVVQERQNNQNEGESNREEEIEKKKNQNIDNKKKTIQKKQKRSNQNSDRQ